MSAPRHVYRRRGPELAGPLLPDTSQCAQCRGPILVKAGRYTCGLAGADHLDRELGDVDSALTAAVMRWTDRTMPDALAATVEAWSTLPADVLTHLSARLMFVVVPAAGAVEVYRLGTTPALASGLAKCCKCRARVTATTDDADYSCSRWPAHELRSRQDVDRAVLDVLADRITKPDVNAELDVDTAHKIVDDPASRHFARWLIGRMFTPVLHLADEDEGDDAGVTYEWHAGWEWDAAGWDEIQQWRVTRAAPLDQLADQLDDELDDQDDDEPAPCRECHNPPTFHKLDCSRRHLDEDGDA